MTTLAALRRLERVTTALLSNQDISALEVAVAIGQARAILDVSEVRSAPEVDQHIRAAGAKESNRHEDQ